MVGFPIEQTKVTHEDLANQLVKQLSVMTLEVSLVKAENEKLKKYIEQLLLLESSNQKN